MRTGADEEAITAAVRAAEARTSGQIVCVLARKSCDASGPAALYAAALALLTPWPLLELTQMPAHQIFAVQALVFCVALLLFGWTPLGLVLITRSQQRREAFRLAAEQFFVRGLTQTRSRAGVLIFVSLAERYARILADEGLDGKITEAEWREVLDLMTAHLGEGRVTEAFVAAVARSGDLLARAAPPDGGGDEIPGILFEI